MSKGDLISRSALLEEYKKLWGNSFSAILDLIRNSPAADVAEVVHGEWIECDCCDPRDNWVKCNSCGYETTLSRNIKYGHCQNCGAKMDGGK